VNFSGKIKLLLILLLSSAIAGAQDTIRLETEIKHAVEPSIIVAPSGISKKDKCAVLFVLPFTGGVSSKYMRVYFNDWNPYAKWQTDYDLFLNKLAPSTPVILVMVSGNTSRQDHDAKGFANAIARFDAQLKKDLILVEKKYSIDKSKLYLTGFSLGGDLSWAISQKNPGMFKGAVVAGTRCGYRANSGFTSQKKNDFKIYLATGQLESPVIVKGIEQAKTDLTYFGIEHMFYEIPNVGHKMLPEEKFLEALRFVMNSEKLIAAAQ
jgi:predicted esterase